MKLSSLATKIAALQLVSAQAANRQCTPPAGCGPAYCDLYGIDPRPQGLTATYCGLYGQDPNKATLFAKAVSTSLAFDPTGAFLQTCLSDLLTASIISLGTFITRQICDDGKTEIALFSAIETSTHPYPERFNVVDGVIKSDVGWLTPMCKSASCDAGVLQQVLTATFNDFYDFIDEGWRKHGWTATSTVTPTAECVYAQIADPVNNAELYCTADAPSCGNIKLAEITIADDAPIEVAICDDNDCLATVDPVDIVGHFATGTVTGSFTPREESELTSTDPFCCEDLQANFLIRNQKYVSAKILDKAFDKTSYCSAAAACARTGRCNLPESSKSQTLPKAPKCPKSAKVSKASKVSKAPKVPKVPKSAKAP